MYFLRYLMVILVIALLSNCASKSTKPKISPIIKEYVIDEIDLVPEGIAYSKKYDAFYLTGVGEFKIVQVDRKTGAQTDFIQENAFGYMPGAGIYVDKAEEVLYAIGGYYRITDSLSTLFSFDLKTRKLIRKYALNDGGEHFLNDLIEDSKGNLYLTDSRDSSIHILKKNGDSLELFFKSPEIEFPNGIAISDDDKKLYIASIPKGVRIMDIATKTILNQQDTLGISQGIDGLEFYNGHLFGVQNSVGANSFNFRKLLLNGEKDSILGVEVIDSHTPKLDVPLTFCIREDEAVVIGNSNLQYLNQETFEFAVSDSIKKSSLLVYKIN